MRFKLRGIGDGTGFKLPSIILTRVRILFRSTGPRGDLKAGESQDFEVISWNG